MYFSFLCLRVYDSGCDFFLHQCDNTKITLLQLIISSAFQMKFSSLVPNCASAILWFVLCQLSNLYSTFVELTNRFCYIEDKTNSKGLLLVESKLFRRAS